MKNKGKVLRSNNNGIVWIKVCHQDYCSGCGHHSTNDAFVEIAVSDPIGVKIGQHIEFETNTIRMLLTILFVFWLPIIATCLGLFLIDYLMSSLIFVSTIGILSDIKRHWIAGVFATLCFIFASTIIYIVARKTKEGSGLRVVAILNEKNEN